MAKPMNADQLIAALRKWGVKYKEYPGWRTRTRPGGIIEARGIVKHHTGGGSASDDYLYFLFVRGRPEDGIPGPLCNVATAPDGTLHLGAIGRANHAGSGSQATMNHVVAEDYNGYADELAPGPDSVNGNAYYYGDEIIYSGLTPPTDAAYRTSVLHAAAVCDFHGWSALSVIAHREHTRRKADPGKVPMTKFRTDLATVLRIGPDVTWEGKTPIAPTPAPSEELFTVGQFEDIMAKLNKIDTDATSRYQDVANRVQAVLNEERARYTDYVGRFNAVLNDLAADPNNPITPEDVAQFREMAASVDRIEQALAAEPPAAELPKA